MKKSWKITMMWVLGALSITIGSMIAGNLQMGLGVSSSGFFVALLISFVLFLVGGLLWITAAMGVRESGRIEY